MLGDAGYGTDTNFRERGVEMVYVVGVRKHHDGLETGRRTETSPDTQRQYWTPTKTTATRCQSQPVPVKELALSPYRSMEESDLEARGEASCSHALPPYGFVPRIATIGAQPHPEEWLLMEWPTGESEPTITGYLLCPPISPFCNWCSWPFIGGQRDALHPFRAPVAVMAACRSAIPLHGSKAVSTTSHFDSQSARCPQYASFDS